MHDSDTGVGEFGTRAFAQQQPTVVSTRQGGARAARLAWYLGRLRSMGPAEIVHRLGEAARKRAWTRRPIGWDALPPGDPSPLPDFPNLRRALAAGSELPGVRRSLAEIGAGHFHHFGRDWPVPDFADPDAGASFWLHDPVTGGSWPGAETAALKVDVRSTVEAPDGTGRLGDVKFVWEPGRLQMLHPLAAAWAAGDAHAARDARAIVASFMATNPPYGGVHWFSGIEMALRLVGLLLVAAAAGPEGLPPGERVAFRRLVAAHARAIAAFPSLHSSANNHRIAEGLGLLVAGLVLAGPEAEGWEGEGRAILEGEAERQILADGVGAEQSLSYQAWTMEMLGLGVVLAREAGRPLGPAVSGRLARGAGFLRAMLDGTGRCPAIGDDDEGRILSDGLGPEPRYVASVTAAIAGLVNRPDLAPPARDPHLRDAIFAAPAEARPVDAGRRIFRDGGYTIWHGRVSGRAAHLVFDHGPIGYLGLAAHGHADALAVWLSVEGRPVLIDAGTYLYHAGARRRVAMRESLAHNTLSVAGASHSLASAGFHWASRADARLVAETDEAVTGAHEGYRRRFGVTHRRRVGRTPEGFVVADALSGSERAHAVEIRFLIHPGLAVSATDEGVAFGDASGLLCRFVPPSGFETRLVPAGRADRDGGAVYAPRFGHLAAAHELVLCGTLGGEEAETRISIG
ncbi:heparinase II/III-family protein [Methylobacterium durans]|uniref:heparinase II/III-family protein n=1 Tax=Methylobacterium durans TaxID=2202825 RepID=UPI002AFFB05A|nr:heparinase II/III-family protein [Methylobacterium durans]MEA1833329.1 heparinase II/III-family protein [Methylobacterium durans]